jgi:serine protease Do
MKNVLITKLLLFIFVGFQITSCATIFLPRKQKISVITNNSKSKVFIDNTETGEGEIVTSKVKKTKNKQVVITTPGYKNEYKVITPAKTFWLKYPLVMIDLACFLYPAYVDLFVLKSSSRGFLYNKSYRFEPDLNYKSRKDDEKYINLEAIGVKIEDKKRDLVDIYMTDSDDIIKKIEKEEQVFSEKINKEDEKASKKKKNSDINKFNKEDKDLKYDNTIFTGIIYKNLKKNGFVDTINKVFLDNNNTISLNAEIKSIKMFHIRTKSTDQYEKMKISTRWILSNSFGEKLDSVDINSFSGEFTFGMNDDNTKRSFTLENIIGDAVEVSFNDLLDHQTFKKHSKIETNTKIKDVILTLKAPKTIVNSVETASESCVIVKRKDGGHGSGFAISNDGYILTNFHVISGSQLDKMDEIKILKTDGTELKARIVRYNRMQDVALLKVETTFPYAFKLNNTKEFKNLLEVYTIGAPKSIELGQTVSLGLISNERKINNSSLLQLNMGINSGNSGGPIFDKQGKLHGVVVSKLFGIGTEGVGFAIPSMNVANYLNLEIK